MKVLQFYTSTGARDAERVGSWSGLLCPDWRVLPFQIQRPATGTGSLTSALLVDCNGATTNILTDLTLEVNSGPTTYDFLTYKGEAFDTYIDYGVYYIQASDGNATWYSDWLDVRPIQPSLLTAWTATGFSEFTVSTGGSRIGVDILTGTTTGVASALSNTFTVHKGEQLYVTTEYDEITASPNVTLNIVSGATAIANQITPTDSEIETGGFSIRATKTNAQLRLYSEDETFSLGRLSLRRYQGDGSYCYMKFYNAKDIQGRTTLAYALTPERESILYASGWAQEIYLNARLNNPQHEIIEVGDEKNGVFEAEKIIDKYIYNIIAYESRSVVNAMRLLPLHSTIQIYDEVGNQYLPDEGNVRVAWDWSTYDTATLRIDFNEPGTVWTNNMDNIT